MTGTGNRDTGAIRVVVDDREPKRGLLEHLQRIDGLSVRPARLSIGDCRIEDRVVVEHKTVRDLAMSLMDGRLLSQARRMAASNLRAVLIIEGRERDLEGVGVRREAIQGALVSVSVLFGIAVLRAVDAEETARLVSYIGRQVVARICGGVRRAGRRPRGKLKRQLYILQGLPGIGKRRAECLLDRFGSVSAVVRARRDELECVDGIGTITATAIRTALD